MSSNWHSGNAEEDGCRYRGWILGHFVDPDEGVRSSKDVEIKWGIHPAGDKRAQWTADDQRTTLVFLVSGKFRIDLTEGSFTLEREDDYLAWGQESITAGKRGFPVQPVRTIKPPRPLLTCCYVPATDS